MDPLKPNILAVDDELGMRDSYRVLLSDNYNLYLASGGKEALDTIKKETIDLVLLDLKLPDVDGLEVLNKIKEYDYSIDVILVTAYGTIKNAVEAMKVGAYDYFVKPIDAMEVSEVLNRCFERKKLSREVLYLRDEVNRHHRFGDVVTQNKEMLEILNMVSQVADKNVNVLIQGESGTGKEIVARAIHQKSNRADKPFVVMNCAAVPDNLLESELFGHERGAFTGAVSQRTGKLEMANGGTFFLDEIGSMKNELQAKLLRVLQHREFERVGGNKTLRVDVRFIAATNSDLKGLVAEDLFREDLYYRLNVVSLNLPPLRNRKEDISELMSYFLKKYKQKFNSRITGFSPGIVQVMRNYHWPGNVRELENVIERAIAICRGDVIGIGDLPLDIFQGNEEPLASLDNKEFNFFRTMRKFEQQIILAVLEKTKWNQVQAAEVLGIHRNTLLKKIKKLGLRETP